VVGEIVAATISAIALGGLGYLAWRGIKPSEMGSSAEASVQAADLARDMMREQLAEYKAATDDKIQKMNERIAVLESKLREERLRFADERDRFERELLRHQRWVDALAEQVVKAGDVPVPLDEVNGY
jgi:flagellar motility protein MotE (MotC chaperone)